MRRVTAGLGIGVAVTVGVPLLVRWIARTTRTQVHRVNQ